MWKQIFLVSNYLSWYKALVIFLHLFATSLDYLPDYGSFSVEISIYEDKKPNKFIGVYGKVQVHELFSTTERHIQL